MATFSTKSIAALSIVVIIAAAMTGCLEPANEVDVPDVIGMTQSAAESAITGAGLSVGSITEEYSNTLPADQVISQNPAAGESVAAGSTVALVVSKGPEGAAQFTPGDEEMSDPISVDDDGATLEGLAGTPIEDVVVHIPAGALHEQTDIQLGYNDGVVAAVAGSPSGVVLDVDAGTTEQFDIPIEISFRYAEGGTKAAMDYVPVPYHIDEEGKLHLMSLIEVDPIEGAATFETYHASWFTWILEVLGFDPDAPETFDTGFRPSHDGFKITNSGSTYNPGGECFGMSAWALWYFSNHSTTSGDFYPRFMDTIGNSGLKGQDIIATRAHNSIQSQWTYYNSIIASESIRRPILQVAAIRNALRNTNAPVMMRLTNIPRDSSGAHAVLAYGFSDDYSNTDAEITMNILDPNHPGDGREIVFDVDADPDNEDGGAWDPYGPYQVIYYFGDGSLSLTEPYAHILDDAEAGFNSDNDAVITITSHEDGDEVPDRTAVLGGAITEGEINITKLKIFVEGQSFTVDIGEDGVFAQEIPIGVGVNEITFETYGLNAIGDLVLVNNNMTSETFELIGTSEQAAILVTLTWDKDDTDVDLYVIDPTGDYSCYYSMNTSDGGILDVDDINGYGPEHWTLTYEDTVRWEEDYAVRLHYYSDHGNGPTNYTVTILLDEGMPWQTLQSFTGTLVTSNGENDGPADTGADWVDIAVVSPTNQAGKRAEIWIPDEGVTLQITAPVPSPEERLLAK